jgi:hypothetical protein
MKERAQFSLIDGRGHERRRRRAKLGDFVDFCVYLATKTNNRGFSCISGVQ